MRILFISNRNFKDTKNGGGVCSTQNYNVLCDIFGGNFVDYFHLKFRENNTYINKIINIYNIL